MVLKYLIMILKKRGYQGGKQEQKIDSTSKTVALDLKEIENLYNSLTEELKALKIQLDEWKETNTEKGVGETKGTSKSPTVSIREPEPKPKSTKIFLFNNVTKRTVGFAIGIFLFIGIIIFPFVKKIYNHEKCRKQ